MNIIENKQLNTPVLFLVFNRLDTTKQVFNKIREAKPPRLYIGADGARQSKTGENEEVIKVREYILNHIDWQCEVKTLFREQNLGCKKAVSGAIDWFFENEEQGIILEDDCMPDSSFFYFCEEMLNLYKDDKRIWHISGDNFQKGIKRGDGSYYFSKFAHIWGWACWRDRWQHYDVDLSSLDNFKEQKIIESIFMDQKEQEHWLDVLTKTKDGKIDTWDYQWSYCVFCNSGLCVMPNVNLISNIGFGPNATHTFDLESELANIKTMPIELPTIKPNFIVINELADSTVFKKSPQKEPTLKRILGKIF